MIKINLKYSLQALALTWTEQISLFPKFVVVTDELALDFDNWFKANEQEMNKKQKEILNKIDQILEKKSQEIEKTFWTNESLKTNDEWEKIRSLAKEALEIFGWSLEKPPLNRNEYIQ